MNDCRRGSAGGANLGSGPTRTSPSRDLRPAEGPPADRSGVERSRADRGAAGRFRELLGAPDQGDETRDTTDLPGQKAGGVTVSLAVPERASQIKATLNATEGLRLQMTLESAADSRRIFERTKDDDRASGQFLYREKALAEGTRHVTICVAPVARAPARIDGVIAQLCVMFV